MDSPLDSGLRPPLNGLPYWVVEAGSVNRKNSLDEHWAELRSVAPDPDLRLVSH